MNLFFNPGITDKTDSFTFDREESRHIVKVLRKSEGDLIYITDGRGHLFRAEVTLADPRHCTIAITDKEIQPERPYYLHMAVAPTKMNDRYEWFLEKATEIGIDEITPVICDHSERTVIKNGRLEKIIQSAVKQSLSAYLPKLNNPVSLADFLEKEQDGQAFMAHCEDGQERVLLQRQIRPGGNYTILIGPEGDFSPEEIEKALRKGYIPVSLGNTRLRTETAAVVACHTAALTNQ
ncbi:16S rRNA (uracil(1498)-N(3))-methyltransferase [Sinomicrobium soli]|uniref:16S rRNA (uracil(1498)-N(3))-methyltransferase n=1 Tax=Sinomicrobium sp. N-1-3-6 TaxID=2219864 RepID=UPI000DCB9F10|nr:16S rRNA (uracil(1498)-N(3))-methyltransferase [Sinomicrobium sp. N-1-3-6]RAV30676.1 16S rRNA (uracil(1498)-N(3))-methyltransferase [Sinomicrobium sp. N-1-3-6]